MTDKKNPTGRDGAGNRHKRKDKKFSALADLKKLALIHARDRHPNYPAHLTMPVRKYTDKTANGLTRCIIDYIKFNVGQAERISNTGRPIDRRQIVTNVIGQQKQIGSIEWIPGTGTNGSSDISATIQGRSVKVEVKCSATSDRYQSEGQKAYQRDIEAAGGLYFIARDFQSFCEWYNETFEKGGGYDRQKTK